MSLGVTGMSLGVTRNPVTHKQTERPRRRGGISEQQGSWEGTVRSEPRLFRDCGQKQNSVGAAPHGRCARTLGGALWE